MLVKRSLDEKLENCIFLDPVSKTDLVRYLKGADVGLQMLRNVPAFYYGTSPNKFFDYIAAGLPVINNYPGWLAEMIRSHKCGFPVRPDDPNVFADALEYAADHRAELVEMGEAGQQLAHRFDRKLSTKKFVQWLVKQSDLKKRNNGLFSG